MGKIAVVGLGYIGLPTAAVLARAGWDVVGVDLSSQRVDAVRSGELPFVEPGLDDLLANVVAQGQLNAQREMPHAQVYIVAVPTPVHGKDNQADLSYVDAVAKAIAQQLVGGELVILESTSPPGTTKRMAELIMSVRPDLSLDGEDDRPAVHVAYCPERVLPGRALEELVSNARIIGGLTPSAAERARDVYASFCEGELVLTDATTAEMAKLTENAFRDVNIAFANELSIVCDKLGIDVWELISLANRHPRVNILNPGPGVGGHCIAVDPWFIVAAAPELSPLICTARTVNDSKPDYVRAKVVGAVHERQATTVALLGLSFKADIDDLRGSPAVDIVAGLATDLSDVRLLVVEPHITELPDSLRHHDNVHLVSLTEALAEAQVVVLLVDHQQFKAITASQCQSQTVIDTRGVLPR